MCRADVNINRGKIDTFRDSYTNLIFMFEVLYK